MVKKISEEVEVVIEKEVVAEEVVKEVEVVKPVEAVAKPSICSHINKHFHGISGKQEDLACTLSAGHTGDHYALAPALRQTEANFETAKKVEGGEKTYVIADRLYLTGKEDCFWSDVAGVPAEEIKPDLEGLKVLQAKRNAG